MPKKWLRKAENLRKTIKKVIVRVNANLKTQKSGKVRVSKYRKPEKFDKNCRKVSEK